MINYVTYEEMLIHLNNGKKARNRYWHESHTLKMSENGDIRLWEKLTEMYSKHSLFDPQNCLEKEEWEILE